MSRVGPSWRTWIRLFLLGLTLSASARAACPQQPPPAATADFQGFKGRIFEKDGKTMPYRLFVPTGYDPGKAYPLVLYLHHAGLIGTDNCIQLTEEAGSGGYGGVFVHDATDMDKKKFATQTKYPHFLVAPQATNSSYGFGGGVEGSATGAEHPTRALVYGILDALSTEFNIDPRRRYVTGISMGCYGTWDMIERRPDYFAGASPQSCRGDPNKDLLGKLVDAPIWSMCGTADSYFAGAKAMADAMTAVGAKKFVFTPFQDVGHSIHNLGYDYPGFIDWMFAQSLPAPVDPGTGGAAGAGAGASSGGTAAAGAAAGGMSTGGAATSGAASGGSSVASGGVAGTGTVVIPPTSAGTAGTSSAVPAAATDDSSCAFAAPLRPLRSAWTALGFGLPLLSALRRRRRASRAR